MYTSVCFNVVVVFWQGEIRNNDSTGPKQFLIFMGRCTIASRYKQLNIFSDIP